MKNKLFGIMTIIACMTIIAFGCGNPSDSDDASSFVGSKVVMGPGIDNGSGSMTTSILIIDAEAKTVTESITSSNSGWGYYSTGVVGNKVVMGRDDAPPVNCPILIVDTVTEKVTEIGDSRDALWGYSSTVVVGDKVVMGRGEPNQGQSILIVDTVKGTAKEIGDLSVNLQWGFGSTTVVRNKVIMGGMPAGPYRGSILIVDTKTETVKEIGNFSSMGRIGWYSTGVVGDKAVMGEVNCNSILIVDTKNDTVEEINKGIDNNPLSQANWGYYSTTVVGDKIVMGRDDAHQSDSILIVDTAKGTVKEIGGFFTAAWGRSSTAVTGNNKVVMGSFSPVNSILIIDPENKTDPVREIKKGIDNNNLSESQWGFDSIAVVENKVVMGPGTNSSTLRNSILIVDTESNTVKEIKEKEGGGTFASANWGCNSMAVIEKKVVMGMGHGSYGASILIVDTESNTVKEIDKEIGGNLLFLHSWGNSSTVVVRDRVVMGRDLNSSGNSILIVDTKDDTIRVIDGLSHAAWGYNSTAVVGDKVVMGRGNYPGSSILIVDPYNEIDPVKEIKEKKGGGTFASANWGNGSTAITGEGYVAPRLRLYASIQKKYNEILNSIMEWLDDKILSANI